MCMHVIYIYIYILLGLKVLYNANKLGVTISYILTTHQVIYIYVCVCVCVCVCLCVYIYIYIMYTLNYEVEAFFLI